MGKIGDFILEKLKEDYCLIVGTDELIDNFSEEFRVDVNIMLMDYLENDDIKTDMFKLFNPKTKEIVTLGMIKKSDMTNILKMGLKAKGESTDDIKDIIGIELEKGEKSKKIFPIMAKSDEDKKRLINDLLKEPRAEDFKKFQESVKNKDKKMKNDENIGYA